MFFATAFSGNRPLMAMVMAVGRIFPNSSRCFSIHDPLSLHTPRLCLIMNKWQENRCMTTNRLLLFSFRSILTTIFIHFPFTTLRGNSRLSVFESKSHIFYSWLALFYNTLSDILSWRRMTNREKTNHNLYYTNLCLWMRQWQWEW